eukprot:COSAG02_NODE_1865_length_10601_cov_116.823748_6_plen_112_part_00
MNCRRLELKTVRNCSFLLKETGSLSVGGCPWVRELLLVLVPRRVSACENNTYFSTNPIQPRSDCRLAVDRLRPDQYFSLDTGQCAESSIPRDLLHQSKTQLEVEQNGSILQ